MGGIGRMEWGDYTREDCKYYLINLKRYSLLNVVQYLIERKIIRHHPEVNYILRFPSACSNLHRYFPPWHNTTKSLVFIFTFSIEADLNRFGNDSKWIHRELPQFTFFFCCCSHDNICILLYCFVCTPLWIVNCSENSDEESQIIDCEADWYNTRVYHQFPNIYESPFHL